ncbi:hypothetical protein IP92_05944 [Pseudoduganella flava]|uniref:Uncharacterized protein n=1 Tax=Pseudoduganella flava TaxID=871742 RepID=A0A562P6S6_9BURK|nr:hypothetical protein [Pseudoduganella flava]QGZ37972.1 hypothetical protein GO485_02190 [Pseudoduganella flava]TWI40128.1 hypothetical protein IP92_05944 [Pseudoduganella flava]
MRTTLPLLLALARLPAHAAPDAPSEPATVIVPGTRIALGWPYSALTAGLARFEDERALAPQAVLRFRLLLADGVTRLNNVVLTLDEGDTLTPVPLGEDGYFSAPRMQAARGARLAVNRNAGQFDGNRTPQPDVRTPGLPPNARRLGDLRLECRVKMAMAKEVIGFAGSLAISALGGIDWCAPRKGGGYGLTAERPVARAQLAEGDRTAPLPVKHGRQIAVPVADRSWSDAALLILDYTSD